MSSQSGAGPTSWETQFGSTDRSVSSFEAAELADSIVSFIRVCGGIKARFASGADPETNALFPLVRLVNEGPQRAKELAEAMSADPSTVSRQVATLVRSGMVERKADPDDGRASILVPTELGVARVQEHFVNRGQMIQPVIADWSPEDRSHFLRLLRCYTQSLDQRREDVLASMNSSHHLNPSNCAPNPPPQASTERSN